MRSKKKPWWQDFQIVTYVVAGLAALGTVIVVSNKYIVLPTRVDAAETKIQQHDKVLDKLEVIEEQNQKLLNVQQQAPNMAMPQTPLREYDHTNKTYYCCELQDPEKCWTNKLWYVCPDHRTVEQLGRPE